MQDFLDSLQRVFSMGSEAVRELLGHYPWLSLVIAFALLYTVVGLARGLVTGILYLIDRARGTGKYSARAKAIRSAEIVRLRNELAKAEEVAQTRGEDLAYEKEQKEKAERAAEIARRRAKDAEKDARRAERNAARGENEVGLGIFGGSFGDPTATGAIGIVEKGSRFDDEIMAEADETVLASSALADEVDDETILARDLPGSFPPIQAPAPRAARAVSFDEIVAPPVHRTQ